MRSGVARGVSIAVLTLASPPRAIAAPSLAWRLAALVAGVPWTTTADGVAAAQLGASIAAGDVNGDGRSDVVVGANRFDSPDFQGAGKAYVFLGSDAGLSATPVWSTEGLDLLALLGTSTAVADFDGDGYADVAVGAPWYGAYAGEAYVYRGSPGGPQTALPWIASGGTFQALGQSIAAADVNGDGYADLLVGVPGALTTSAAGVRLYLGSADGLAKDPAWSATGDGQAGSRLGEAMAAGDLDGDGYADLAVAAPAQVTGQAGGGKVFVYYGAAQGPGPSADWTFEGDGAGGGIGAHRGLAMGDVDGDGFLDLVVGASGYDTPAAADAGRVWVFLGGPGGLGTTPAWASSGDEQAGAGLGDAVATADLDGDGYAEVIAGAPLADTPALDGTLVADAGSVWVFRGSPAGPLGLPGLVLTGDPELVQQGAGLGGAVASVGDVDGDGVGDLAVGAPLYDVGVAADAGRVWVFGGPEVMSCSADGTCAPPEVYASADGGCRAAADCDDGDPCSLDVCAASGGCVYRPGGCAAGPCGDDPRCTFGEVTVAVGPRSPADVTIQPGSSAVVAQLELRTGGIGGVLAGLRVTVAGGSGSGRARLAVHEDADGDGLLDDGSTPVGVGEAAPLSGGILAVEGMGLALPPATARTLLLVLEPVPSAEAGGIARSTRPPAAAGPWLLAAAMAGAAALASRRRAAPRARRFAWRPLVATALLCAGLGSLGVACGRTLLAGTYEGRVGIASGADVTVEPIAPGQLVVRGPPLEAARFRVTLR